MENRPEPRLLNHGTYHFLAGPKLQGRNIQNEKVNFKHSGNAGFSEFFLWIWD